MAKVPYRTLPREEYAQLKRELRCCFTYCQRKALSTLLLDLLTESEKVMLARRLRVAQQLLQGKIFEEIRQELGVGFDTIYNVDRWLEQKFDHYRAVLPPLLARQKDSSKKHPIPLTPYTFRWLRKRYPAHFLLFNLLLGDPQEYEEEG